MKIINPLQSSVNLLRIRTDSFNQNVFRVSTHYFYVLYEKDQGSTNFYPHKSTKAVTFFKLLFSLQLFL